MKKYFFREVRVVAWRVATGVITTATFAPRLAACQNDTTTCASAFLGRMFADGYRRFWARESAAWDASAWREMVKNQASAGRFQQDLPELGRLSGLFHMDAQNYFPDSAIGAPNVPERLRLNAFANLNYTHKHFSAGVRFEDYRHPLLGFPAR
ncbi:MAG: DUF6029 family protein, partial [Bacteroidia bacterium]|nr:DUF6029 family protein [Bacteroidia bacterium]